VARDVDRADRVEAEVPDRVRVEEGPDKAAAGRVVYPGIGWLLFREPDDLHEDLVFYENYLGEEDATSTLNFSTGSSMVLAQYYNICRFGRRGYARIIGEMAENARYLAKQLEAIGEFELIGVDRPQLPLVCFSLSEGHAYDEFDISGRLAAARGWMVPAYTLPPDAQEVTVMRALVTGNVGHAAARTLVEDLAVACKDLAKKGGIRAAERSRAPRAHHR
jgi:glutamate decarboxylase